MQAVVTACQSAASQENLGSEADRPALLNPLWAFVESPGSWSDLR
jgi:hypothetical protein